MFHKDHTVTVEDVPEPVIGDSDVLVRVLACGVCGTDLRIQAGEFLAESYPVIPGHEVCGRVEAVGRRVENCAVGDLVAVNPNMSCGTCYWCLRGRPHLCPDMQSIGVTLPGGFAEYLAAPARQVLVMPSHLAPEAAAMMEPVSCCVHGLDLAGISAGDPTVILGGGSVGLILLQLARHAGAAPVVVVEPLEAKRNLALSLGADEVVDPSGLSAGDLRRQIDDATGGGPQVVIEASGHEAAARIALALPRRGGTVLFFGVQQPSLEIPLRPFDVYHHEVTIRGAFTNPLTDSRARQMLITGRVEVLPLITHRFGLQDMRAALQTVRAGLAVKAMVMP